MKNLRNLVLLISAFLLSSCSTFRRFYNYDDPRPPRSSWMRKTGQWLNETKRQELTSHSMQLTRLKEVTKKFNIRTLYVNTGRSELTYRGYRDQGLFALCRQLKSDGITAWAWFPVDDWSTDVARTQELKSLVTTLKADNDRNGRCFKGVHYELQQASLDLALKAKVADIFKDSGMPVSLRAHSAPLAQFASMVEEGILLDTAWARTRQPATAKTPRMSRNFIDLGRGNTATLSLDQMEDHVLRIESNNPAPGGAAIDNMETLMARYNKEVPLPRYLQ